MPSRPPSPLAAAARLFQAGQLDRAASQCSLILRHQPGNADALHLLGAIRGRQGAHREAAELLARAGALQSGSYAIWRDLGFALWTLKQYDAASASYRKAIALRPRDAALHASLGELLLENRQPDAAIVPLEAAAALDPRNRIVRNSLGLALMRSRRYDAAIGCFQAMLAAAPDFADGHYNLGLALRAMSRLDDAVAAFRRACDVDPNHVHALNDIGNTLQLLRRHDAALEFYQKVLAIRPDDGHALAMCAFIQRHLCDWRDLDTSEATVLDAVRSRRATVVPFAFLQITDDPSAQLLCARQYWAGRNIASALLPAKPSAGHERLRLAYLSPDFREHPVAQLSAELFEIHDRARFHVTGLSCGVNDGSAMRARLEQAFDEFLDVSAASDGEIARLIRSREIDIVVDMGGLTAESRVAALATRPAPLQVHYLGYPATLGTDFIDYMIVDRFVVPPDQAGNFTEQLVYLPQCYQVNDRKRPPAEDSERRQEHGLPDGAFVFCCFNNNFKIAPRTFDIWMRLLGQVPHAVLWLLADNASAEANLRREAQARGIAPGRLVFAPRLPQAGHLARHRLADLFLDTLPYNAHTTASDALWAGLPVLTLAGRGFAARVAGSLLQAVGMPELITHSPDEYERLALRLATRPDTLPALRRRLEDTRRDTPLFDTDQARRHLEAAYLRMWRIAERGDAPRGFAVNP
jgi:predicted O-linked N-acetylglucosamine transferase (SPINDLY family)